jgi:hypothetical protein
VAARPGMHRPVGGRGVDQPGGRGVRQPRPAPGVRGHRRQHGPVLVGRGEEQPEPVVAAVVGTSLQVLPGPHDAPEDRAQAKPCRTWRCSTEERMRAGRPSCPAGPGRRPPAGGARRVQGTGTRPACPLARSRPGAISTQGCELMLGAVLQFSGSKATLTSASPGVWQEAARDPGSLLLPGGPVDAPGGCPRPP